MSRSTDWLITTRNDFAEPSIFRPEAMLRETRRQRQLPAGSVPAVCLLDPDGDVIRQLSASGQAQRSTSWACYHSELWEVATEIGTIGIVGCAVGAAYAVLVAEQLFVSGCSLLVSITSAGQIDPELSQPSVVLIDRAVRGEGTSYAYLPPHPTIEPDPQFMTTIARGLAGLPFSVFRGTSWTTDAPYRETETAIAAARALGARVVEMEAAGLYAFGLARHKPVVCFAHVTNTMAVTEIDFEKGPADGVIQAMQLVTATGQTWYEHIAADEYYCDRRSAKRSEGIF